MANSVFVLLRQDEKGDFVHVHAPTSIAGQWRVVVISGGATEEPEARDLRRRAELQWPVRGRRPARRRTERLKDIGGPRASWKAHDGEPETLCRCDRPTNR